MTAFKMSRLGSVAAASLLAALFATTPAQAQNDARASAGGTWVFQGDELVYHVPFRGQRSRAEVRNEAIAALRNGEHVRVGDEVVSRQVAIAMGAMPAPGIGLSRAQVVADAAASRARGDWIQIADELIHRDDPRAYGQARRGSVTVHMIGRAGN